MSHYGLDPADYRAGELAEPMPDLRLLPCAGCRVVDGSLDTERMDQDGRCTFGCGRIVDEDRKYCPTCRDHSANCYECDECGTRYEKWGDAWEEVR